jgi:hypothetical protein
MARTINEIVQELRAAFVANPTVAAAYNLQPDKTFDDQFSAACIEAVDTHIVATALALAERIQEADKAGISAIVERNRIGTGNWYVEMAKRFQWNDREQYFLQVDPGTGIISYNIDAPSDRIVSQAAYMETSAKEVFIKVARGEAGALQPLTDDQVTDFLNYMRRIKIAGIMLNVVNLPADILRLQVNVYYSRSYNSTNVRQAIIDSLNAYSLSLEFNGIVLRNAVIDAIQRVQGVVDVDIIQLHAATGNLTHNVERAYTTAAGHFNFQQDNTFPIINLIAE